MQFVLKREWSPVSGRMRAVALLFVVASLFVSMGASAQSVGQFYRHDDSRYWWYEAHDRSYEIALPANPIYTVHKDLFGETSLEIPLKEGGPYIRLSSFPGGRAALDRARSAVQTEWQHVLTDTRLSENRTIQTRTGLDAHFIVIQGRTAAGANGMVRAVFYNNGDQNVALVWAGNTADYTGRYLDAWIEAVNSFSWLR